MLALVAAGPARASHESIVVDADLTDLIQAVNDNLTTGGFADTTDPLGEIYTGKCSFVNGFDIRKGYVLLDYTDGLGNYTPDDITLYAGWVMEGIVGDTDGDGNPDQLTPGSPGESSGCATSDLPGIATTDAYSVLFDLDCASGPGAFNADLAVSITDNKVYKLVGVVYTLLPGATFARNGRFLELKVPNYQDLLAGLPTPNDLCDAKITMSSDSREDGPGEDRLREPFIHQVPPSVTISKTPPVQEICAGQNAQWTITVRNNGLCMLDVVTVMDTLQAGLTFVTSNPPPASGSGQERAWTFNDMAPGDSAVITLTAMLQAPCPGDTLENRVTVEAVHESPCRDTPAGAVASTSAQVVCVEPCATLDEPEARFAACPGDTVIVPFTFASCSDRAQTITYSAYCDGQLVAGPLQVALPANGQTVVDVTCILPAECRGTVIASLEASVNVDGFQECNLPLQAQKSIDCYDPCLTIAAVEDTLRGCGGSDVTASFWVKNCTLLDTLDLALTADCGPMTPVGTPVIPEFLAPGDSVLVTVTCTLPVACDGPYRISLSGAGTIRGADCAANATAGTVVECVEACLALEYNRGPAAVCAGDTFAVVFDVRNCSTTDTADVDLAGLCDLMDAISVTPPTLRLGPGQQAEVTVTCAMPAECAGNVRVTLNGSASVVGLSGPACVDEKSVFADVECREVCLAAVAPPDTAACAGDTVTVAFTVSNCNEPRDPNAPVLNGEPVVPLAQHYVITASCNGVPVVADPAVFVLAPGQSLPVHVTCVLPETCDGPLTVDFKAVASFVEDAACADSTTATATIDCYEACATLTCPTDDPLMACVNDTISVVFRAKNCNTSGLAEVFGFLPQTNGTLIDWLPLNAVVAAGDSVDVTVRVRMPAECSGNIWVDLGMTAAIQRDDACTTAVNLKKEVRCVEPCLIVEAPEAPIVVCAPGEGTVVFTVINCSAETEVVDFTALCGVDPVAASPANAVMAPGESLLVTVVCPVESCVRGVPHTTTLRANGHVQDAVDCTVAAEASKNIDCTVPCLDVLAQGAPAFICAGDTIQASWAIVNCNPDYPETVDYVVTANGVPFFSTSVVIAAGDTAFVTNLEFIVPDTCETEVVLELSADGQLAGFPETCRVSDKESQTVDCLKPCLTIDAPEVMACAGDTITAVFYVTNCGQDPELVALTADCGQATPISSPPPFLFLAPGETDTITVLCLMPMPCQGDITIELNALAKVVPQDQVGTASAAELARVVPTYCELEVTKSTTARCVEACAQLYCPPGMELAGCVNETVTVAVWARNCNTLADLAQNFTFNATCNGLPVDVTPANALVAAGDSVQVTLKCVMPPRCDGPLTVNVTAEASLAIDPDCKTRTEITKEIRCVEPCIVVTATEAPLTVCAPDTARAGFWVRNCSEETEVVDLTGYCDAEEVAVSPAQVILAPGDSLEVFVVCFIDSCTAAAPHMARLVADATVEGTTGCSTQAEDTKVIGCTTPCLTVDVYEAPRTICAGDSLFTYFSISNCNPTYAEEVSYTASCGPDVVADVTTQLGPGGSTIVKVACLVPDTCSTNITVQLIGTGQVLGFPEACRISDTTSVTVDCLKPCIDLVAPEPIPACAGTARVPVPFVLTNCSDETEVYSCLFYCDGEPQNFDGALNISIPAGESDTLIAYCDLPETCDGDVDVRMIVNALVIDPATGEPYQGCAAADTADTKITCVEACVSVEPTAGYGPYAGCAGDTVATYFTLKNCGAEAESIFVSATCNGEPFVFDQEVVCLDGGDSLVVAIPCVLPETCDGPIGVTFSAVAKVKDLTACMDEASTRTTIACLTPCLIVEAQSDSLSGCAGDTVDVQFRVANCNTDDRNEIFTFTATCNGEPVVVPTQNVVLAPGGSTIITIPCILPADCGGDVIVTLTATAAIEGYEDCTLEMSASKPIGCAEGCVTIAACQAEIIACAASTAQVPFVIKNCTGATEELVTLTATCDGEPIVLEVSQYVLGPGDSVVVNVPCVMPDWCMGAVEVSLTVDARKNGDVEGACPATATATCPVYCVEACVSACERWEGLACPGDSICVPFEVMNCNEFATEVFTFKYKIDGGPILMLPITLELGPGEKDTVCVPVRMPDQCDADGVKVILEPFAAIKDLPGCRTKGYAEAIIECGVACITVEGPADTTVCPGDTLKVPFLVTNCGTVPMAVNMMAAVGGVMVDPVEPHHFELQPGESTTSFVCYVVPEDCPPGTVFAVVNSAWAMSPNGDGCVVDVADDVLVTCRDCEIVPSCGPLALEAPPAAQACPGDPIQVQFTVENQGEALVDAYLSTTLPGWTIVPPVLNDLAPGVPTVVTASGDAPEDFNVAKQLILCGAAYPATTTPADTTGQLCDIAKDIVNVTAKKILFSVNKTASPDTVTALNSISRITIVISNAPGAATLDPIQVTDYMPSGIAFAGNVTSNCGATTSAAVGDTCVMFTPISLAPGSSCTISFDVACQRDGAFVDTVIVRAYCDGSEDAWRELRDTARVVCKEAKSACPRTIGFWRAQCEQKSNGSRKICENDPADGMDMQRLWRQVIDASGLEEFKANSQNDNSSMIPIADLRALGNEALNDALCCQLEGPNPMTKRDQAERQYLALLLNVRMGLLPLDVNVDNTAFMGSVQEAIDAIESVLNDPTSDDNEVTGAKDIADTINNRLGLLAQSCPGGENAPFGNFGESCPAGNQMWVCPGDEDDAPDTVGNTNAPATGRPSMVAFPNPFNPTAILRFTVPLDKVGQHGVVEVFDATGRPVERLFEGTIGNSTNEILLTGDGWASGMYIARLTVGGESVVYRLMLVK